MGIQWQPVSKEVMKNWIDTILAEASDDLSEWETTFVNDMQIRLDNGWPWTEKQQQKLESIYAEKTP